MDILVATANMHKLRELAGLLPGHSLRTPAQVGFPDFDVEEDGETFSQNALKKAFSLFELTGLPSLADDSGLAVRAMSGGPGVRSARYGSPDGRTPLASAERNALLLREMEAVADRRCAFVCCLALVFDHERYVTVQETCPGLLLESPRGENGFGYDPVVYLPELEKTVAELSPAEKNIVSHRGRAAALLRKLLD
ncbi:MAG: non-canonical purine NTP pyrophosphatase [Rectinema sp.]